MKSARIPGGRIPVTLTLWGLLLGTILGAVLVLLTIYPRERREDYRRLAQEAYDSVFLSMYPITTYKESDYSYYRAYQLIKADYEIPSLGVMESYIRFALKHNPSLSRVYLGIVPKAATDGSRLARLLSSYPSVYFEVVPAYPSMEYWRALSPSQYEDKLEAYQGITTHLSGLSNASLYLYGSEAWLSANPKNYLSPLETNAEVSGRLMLYTDSDHGYNLDEKTGKESLDRLRSLTSSYRQSPPSYPHMSGTHMVFLGDSIIGNATDSTSIPSLVSALTGAATYNLGYGGNSASLGEKTAISLPAQIDLLASGEYGLLPKDAPIAGEVLRFLEVSPPSDSLVFVINYGLNDYFNGYPVRSGDTLDVTTYEGALRASVRSIREHFPEARIMLCTPSFVSYFNFGGDVCSPVGGSLSDYIDAVIALGADESLPVFNSFDSLPITPSNYPEYLTDGCHHNERGRFLFSTRLSEQFSALSSFEASE